MLHLPLSEIPRPQNQNLLQSHYFTFHIKYCLDVNSVQLIFSWAASPVPHFPHLSLLALAIRRMLMFLFIFYLYLTFLRPYFRLVQTDFGVKELLVYQSTHHILLGHFLLHPLLLLDLLASIVFR